jgi:predicted alpha/beta-fold hydrolase
MVGLADKAFLAGFNVIRLNQRNCGETEHLSPGLYHSGLTEDPAAVLKELIEVDKLSSFVVAGYSLGGNLAVKLAGDYGDCAPPQLHAACVLSLQHSISHAVSPHSIDVKIPCTNGTLSEILNAVFEKKLDFSRNATHSVTLAKSLPSVDSTNSSPPLITTFLIPTTITAGRVP